MHRSTDPAPPGATIEWLEANAIRLALPEADGYVAGDDRSANVHEQRCGISEAVVEHWKMNLANKFAGKHNPNLKGEIR